MKYYFTSTEMAIIKKIDNDKRCEAVKKLEPSAVAGENVKMVQQL